jgi:hypothetical protein
MELMNNPELPPHSQPAFSVRERAEANVRANPLAFVKETATS